MCPVCKEPLIVFEFEGVEIDHCVKCLGTWLDEGELDTLAEIAGAGWEAWEGSLARAEGEKHGERRCPRCRSRLRVVDVSGVEIDRCNRGCGIWFDKGEIPKLIEAFGKDEEGAVVRFFSEMFKSELGG